MADEVLIERRGRVLLITLNRPGDRNALNHELSELLEQALTELDRDDGLTIGILTGAGKGFCSGMDLKAFAQRGPSPAIGRVLRGGTKKPLIAAIEGFAVAGGLELALTCDLLVAAKGAKLGIPEAGVGLFAAGGGLFRLQQRLPLGVAMEMAITADPITAERAYEYGLVTRLAEPGQAVEVALALAERVAKNAPLSVAVSKQLIAASAGLTEDEFWELQKPLIPTVFESQDAKEGPRAFAEKRAPVWSGR
ncbi:MAG TPA: crotonase/enoyl-CoA hydratase family protein [Acidimicrobiia bacterium]|nr:crotonase/enoyl-CoA hydratase family protein [Acidimicrobiia bacterium]